MSSHHIRVLTASVGLALLAHLSAGPALAAMGGPNGEGAYGTPGGRTAIVPGPNQEGADATTVRLLTHAEMKLLKQAGYKLDQIKANQFPGKARLSEFDVYTAGGKLYVGPKGQGGLPVSRFKAASTGLNLEAIKDAVHSRAEGLTTAPPTRKEGLTTDPSDRTEGVGPQISSFLKEGLEAIEAIKDAVNAGGGKGSGIRGGGMPMPPDGGGAGEEAGKEP